MKKPVMVPEPGLAYAKQECAWMVPIGRRGIRINIGSVGVPAAGEAELAGRRVTTTSRKSDAVTEAIDRLKKSARLYQKLVRFSG